MENFSVSVIVVCQSIEQADETVHSIRKLLRESDSGSNYELLIAEGNNPSEQRNHAAAQATKRWILFLDNDAVPDLRIFDYYKLALAEFSDAKVLGGPSLLVPETENAFELSVQGVFSCDLGVGPLKARYFPMGKARLSGEKELILCNMLIDRELFVRTGGFLKELYPNEENEFLNRIASQAKVVYCPGAIVYRTHRKTIFALAYQMLRYGRGRVKHYRINPGFIQLVFFLPMLFLLYFALLPLLISRFGVLPSLAPALVYLILTTFQGLIASVYYKRISILPYSVLSFFACHFFYGAGLLAGLVPGRRKPGLKVQIQKIALEAVG